MSTHSSNTSRRLLTAFAGLALALSASPADLLQAQTSPTTSPTASTGKPPWVIDRPDTGTAAKMPTASATVTGQVASDSAYIREAASINAFEVRAGQLASARASNSAVKQFGRQMITDHSTMGRKWTALASKNGLPTDVTLNSIQLQSADRLSKLSGTAFDQAYMQTMVEDHDQAASTLQRIAAGAQSSEVKQLAASGVSGTQQHLATAQQVASQIGTASAVATNSPKSPANGGRRNNNDNNKGNAAEGEYARDLAYDHILEVRLARLAQKRTKNQDVKKFAEQAAGDFGKWQGRWADLARERGTTVHPDMGPKHRARVTRLEQASSGNFDQVYLNLVTDNLGSMVPHLEKQGHEAQSSNIRNTAGDELSSVREKLATAQRLEKQSGKSLSEKK
ncbi:MAG: DUF4142 domain-containing protein [Chloroflexota bacterium]